MSAAKVQQDPEAGKGASKHADDSDGIESTFRRRGGGISAEQVQSIVRGEIQALVKAGVLTLTGPMPESLLPAIEASAPEPVTAVAVGATAALGQTKKLVPQHNMPKLLGLPDFLEALDMPSEMLDHMIKDSIKSWELTGEVDQRVKDFATVFMRHHRWYHSEVMSGNLDVDVYFILAATDYGINEVAGDRENVDDTAGKEAGTYEKRSRKILCLNPLQSAKLMSAGKVIAIGLTQFFTPAIILYDTIYTQEVNGDDGYRTGFYDGRYCNWGVDVGHGKFPFINRLVLLVFMTYLAVYGYYMCNDFLESMYFEHVNFSYYKTCHQFWIQIGLIANGFATLQVVLTTAVIMFYTESVMDQIMNAMALIFVKDLDNELVSGAESSAYVTRFERWMNIAYVNWTDDAHEFPKKFRKGYRRKHSKYAACVNSVVSSKPFLAFCGIVVSANFLTPLWLFFCW